MKKGAATNRKVIEPIKTQRLFENHVNKYKEHSNLITNFLPKYAQNNVIVLNNNCW